MVCRLLLLGLILPMLLAQAAAGAANSLPPASQWIAEDAIAAVEISSPKAILDPLLGPEVARAVQSSAEYQKQAAGPGFPQFLAIVKYVEMQLGTDWKTAVRNLFGGGVIAAVRPNGELIVIVDTQDAKLLRRVHEVFLGFAKDEAKKRNQPERGQGTDYRGNTIWTLGEGQAHCIVKNRLIFANRASAVKTALDLRAGEGKSLASQQGYRAARQVADEESIALACLNLSVLKQNPLLRAALAQEGNPLSTLFLHSLTESLRDSNWLILDVQAQGHALSLTATVDGKRPGAAALGAFTWPQEADQGTLPNLAVPRRIAAMSLFRDLHAFYSAKDKLFPERTSGLIFFENMMGIFFSGRDLNEEVMAATHPQVRLVAARQEYDREIGTPAVQVPAFAAVFRLRNPKQGGAMAEEAWQKAIGLVNTVRGQHALPGLVFDRDTFEGTKFTVSYFSAAEEKDKAGLDVRFNFRPSIVRTGEYLLLCSTDGLAKDLITALKREQENGPGRSAAGIQTLLEIDGSQAVSILTANRKHLARNNMLEKGASLPQAESQIDALIAVVRHIRRLTLSIGSHKDHPQAVLEIQWSLPKASGTN